ncbi:DUF6891 domain-containing protein [Streptomyces sp. NPDC059696]|uniref:DUF6891 domain-containing protein n=1 Tax=Streptomyces sp. NPDC059696 TaxID=3346911 RepID=UPI003692BC4A
MEIDGGLAVKVLTESGRTHARVSAGELRELVERIGGAGDRFLVVRRIPDRPRVFIQTARDEDGAYDVQHRTTTTAVGHEVVAAPASAGLSAQWDGDPGKAIDVTPLEWRKRLVG